jgi:hypothetical protein
MISFYDDEQIQIKMRKNIDTQYRFNMKKHVEHDLPSRPNVGVSWTSIGANAQELQVRCDVRISLLQRLYSVYQTSSPEELHQNWICALLS